MSHHDVPAARRSGFSLIEMLIAVTVLALLGTIVIRVFLTSEKMNQQALALDRAVALSVDAVERLKAGIPADAVDRDTLTVLFPEATLVALADGWQVELLLDDAFQSLPPEAGLVSEHLMSLVVSADPQTEKLSSLVSVNVHARRHDVKGPEPTSVPPASSRDGLVWDAEPIFTLAAAIPAGCEIEEVAP